jgi:hypothetical protein
MQQAGREMPLALRMRWYVFGRGRGGLIRDMKSLISPPSFLRNCGVAAFAQFVREMQRVWLAEP